MASVGVGSTPHVNGELFKVMTGTNMVHVPYRGAAAVMTDLLSGQVQLYFGTTASSLEYVRTGKLRALAVTIERRLDALPDIPTVGDFVPGYEATNWYGIGAPRNTPVEVIEKLNKETNAGLADPKIKARIADLGGSLLTGSPADFGRLIADETENGQGGQVRGHQGGLNRADGVRNTRLRECVPMTAAGPNPDFLLGGRTSASTGCRHARGENCAA